MTLQSLDLFFRDLLGIEAYSKDPSLNGIQVQNSDVVNKEIKKVAFAVDVSEETIDCAIDAKADLLFVHHGLFWGDCMTITGTHYKKIKKLIENDIALYACHIPLDANNPYGNNYGIAARLGLVNIQPFGIWHEMVLGVKGELPYPLTTKKIIDTIFPNGEKCNCVLDFGPAEIKTVGIISGGASSDLIQAVDEGLDAYITGELHHSEYSVAKENSITAIAGGHYNTETFGVSLVKEKLEREKKIETVFISAPTGL